MTVWVVYADYGFEGPTEPLGVFSDCSLAKAFTRDPKNSWRSGKWVIKKFTVDEN